MVPEANDLHAAELPVAKQRTQTQRRMLYPLTEPIYEPLGLDLMDYSSKISNADKEFLEAVALGQRMMFPNEPTNPPVATAATAAAAAATEEEEDEFGDTAWMEGAIAEMESIPVPESSPDRAPSPATKKKASRPNPGATTWNRKEGSRSIHSRDPLRMMVQEPLGEGQTLKASQIMADLVTNAPPKQITTATGTAKAFQQEWNRQEAASLINQQPSMGGMMSVGVAKSVVMGMVNHQVSSMANPIAPKPTLVTATEAVRPALELPAPPVKQCSADELYEYIVEYKKLPGLEGLKKPGNKTGRLQVLLEAMQKHKNSSTNN